MSGRVAAASCRAASCRAALRGLAVLVLLLGACAQPAEERADANAAAESATLGTRLTVKVAGGTVAAVTEATSTSLAKLRVRAQSLDVRIDLSDLGCAPRTVEITVTHLAPSGLKYSFRPLLDALPPEVTAAEGALGGLLDFRADPHDAERTPVDAERAFETSPGIAPDVRRFWVTLDRGRRQVRIDALPPAAVPAEVGACVTLDADAAGPLGQAALVARLRLRQPLPAAGHRFAVFGNVASHLGTLDAMMASINTRQPAFVVISGDLTANGTPSEMAAAIDRLDRTLTMPWYATVGDRDVSSDLQGTLVRYLGRTQFVLDAGATRVLVLDSADASLSSRGHSQLEDWLADAPLWWAGDDPPATRVVITHVPPFDPQGARNLGFHQRLEAGRVLAALHRADVAWLITSQVPAFSVETVAGVPMVNGGGGGAPLNDSSRGHFWVEVAVAGDCVAPGDVADTADACGGCAAGSRCVADVAECGPCVTVTPIYF